MNSGCGTKEEEEQNQTLGGAGIWAHCDDGDATSA